MAEALQPYVAVLTARFRMLLQYRAAALAGFSTQLYWGAIKLMILAAFFASNHAASPMSVAQIAAYVWLGQALLGLLPWNVDPELQEKMTTGAVAYELLRPLDLYAFWYARTVAMRTATAFLRMIPMIVVAAGVLPLVGLADWSLRPPTGLASGVAFAASLVATVALASAVTMLMHISLIWTLSGRGVNTVMTGVVIIGSGLVVPLPFFPQWAQGLLYWQPFRGLADTPFRIYSGHIDPRHAAFEIAVQIAWTAVIVGIGYALMARARTRVVVQGG